MDLSKDAFLEAKPPLKFVKAFEIVAKPKVTDKRLIWHGCKPNQAVTVGISGDKTGKVSTMVSAQICGSSVSKEEFMAKAEPLAPEMINALVADAKPLCFSTGSLGWYVQRTQNIKVKDLEVKVSLQFQAVLNGTKPKPAG